MRSAHSELVRLAFTNVSHRVAGMRGEAQRVVTYLPDPSTGTRRRILAGVMALG